MKFSEKRVKAFVFGELAIVLSVFVLAFGILVHVKKQDKKIHQSYEAKKVERFVNAWMEAVSEYRKKTGRMLSGITDTEMSKVVESLKKEGISLKIEDSEERKALGLRSFEETPDGRSVVSLYLFAEGKKECICLKRCPERIKEELERYFFRKAKQGNLKAAPFAQCDIKVCF